MNSKRVYKLNTLTPKRLVTVLGLLLLGVLFPACGKKCQQSETSFRFLSETQWRLVETTDRSADFRKLNNYTFDIWSFGDAFRGDVKAVINNEQFDIPKCTMVYKPADGQMAIQFSAGGGGAGIGEEASDQPANACPFTGTRIYSYKVGRDLQMTDEKTGKYYRFVPFLGIVQPDLTCTF